MNFFLDSNVIIGYCIEIDYWFHYAERTFEYNIIKRRKNMYNHTKPQKHRIKNR